MAFFTLSGEKFLFFGVTKCLVTFDLPHSQKGFPHFENDFFTSIQRG